MAKKQITLVNVKLTSSYSAYWDSSAGKYTSTPTTATSTAVTVDMVANGIPSGSTINSVTQNASYTSSLHGYNIRDSLINGTVAHTGVWSSGDTVLNKALITGNTFTFAMRFQSWTSSTTYPNYPNAPSVWNSSTVDYTGITLTIDYTPPYTAVTAPTSVTGGTTSAVPGGTYRISWSGASGGTNNPVASYTLRRNDGTEWTTTNAYYDVSASTTNGGSYSYTVRSNATVAGYSSGFSSASTTLTTSFSQVTAPTAISLSSSYVTSGSVTLSWSGAGAGTNNPVTGYQVQYSDNGGAWANLDTAQTGTTLSVASLAAGNYRSYRVITIGTGTRGNSGASSTVTLYTYSAPQAPGGVTLAQTTINAGTTTTLSWNAAGAGHWNAVVKYHIYISANGAAYAYLGETTGLSYTVTAHSTQGANNRYVVYTIGARSNSGASAAVQLNTEVYSAVGVPGTVRINSATSAYVTSGNGTLTWTQADNGTNTTVVGYQVYRNGVAYGAQLQQNVLTRAVESNTAGNSYTYTVVAVSSPAGYNSAASAGAVIYTYGSPSAPSAVTINGVAGTTYFGANGRPTITLAWSGASGGTHSGITGYRIYKGGSHIATVNTTATSGSYTITTGDGAYTVATVAASGLVSSASIGRTVTSIGVPAAATFTSQPSGKSNGSVSYAWNLPTLANATMNFHVSYRNGSTGNTWIQGTGETRTFSLNVNSYITQGNYYQLGVLTRAMAAHGGYTDAAEGYLMSTANQAYRAAAPQAPSSVVAKDSGGNTSYSYLNIAGTFAHSQPQLGATVSKYTVYYRTGTGGFTKLMDITNTALRTFTHNIASFGQGLVFTYRVEVTDEYGYTAAQDSAVITKLNLPTISSGSVSTAGVPNTSGTVTFTPGNGGVSRPLKVSISLAYKNQEWLVWNNDSITTASGVATSRQLADLSINKFNTQGLTSLFTDVITNRIAHPNITVKITVQDNQSPAVVGNSADLTPFTYTADYRTFPTMTGTMTMVNQTAAGGTNITYVNSRDVLRINMTGLTIGWTNAAGTTVGQNLIYQLKDYTGTNNLTAMPSGKIKDISLGVFSGDGTLTSSLEVIQNYADTTTSSGVKSASIPYKRFQTPSITFSKIERTDATTWKAEFNLSDPLSGGSSTVNNVQTFSDFDIKATTSISLSHITFSMAGNKVIATIGGIADTMPSMLTGLNATSINDITVNSSAKLTLTSGQVVTITSAPFLLKALGVALAIRKTRIGINVEPSGFKETLNSATLVITESQINTTTPYIVDIQSAANNTVGVGVRFYDVKNSNAGVLKYLNNTFYFDKSISIQGISLAKLGSIFTASTNTQQSAIFFPSISGSSDPGFIIHETSSVAADSNKGVLHLCPSDDNDNVNDYVTIHGTNDAEILKLYTGGNIEAQAVSASSFSGPLTGNVTGNATTATTLQTARTLTIGSTGKTFNGSANVSWTLAEIGAAAASHGNHVHSDSLTMGNNIDYNNLVYDWSKHLLLQPIHTPNYTGVLNSPVGNDYGALITLAAGTSFPVQFAISNGASIFKVRSKYASDTAGTKWTGIAWRTLLHDGNYNSYAPTKTGTGASGTWGISVTGSSASCTGNAATATNAATLTTARTLTIGSTGKTFNGSANVSWSLAEIGAAASSHSHTSGYYNSPLTGSDLNNYLNTGMFGWASAANAPSTYGQGINIVSSGTSHNNTSNWITQLGFSTDGDGYFRTKVNNSGWGSWYKFLHSGNYNSYAPSKTGTGASGTWGISITGNAATATTASDSSKLGGLSLGNATQGSHPGANTVVRTDGNGYLNVGWINTVSGSATGTPTRIYCSQDAYLRYYAPSDATLRRSLGAYIRYGTSLPTTGNATGDIFLLKA